MLPDLKNFLKANRAAEVLGVYDGRMRVGTVAEVEGGAAAFDALGNRLGTFKRRREAIAAVPVPLVVGAVPAPSQQGGA
jgi:hypothetical protein